MPDDPVLVSTVACLACDYVQRVEFRDRERSKRFACVNCGKCAVKPPAAGPPTVEPYRAPQRPWVLTQSDRWQLAALRITAD